MKICGVIAEYNPFHNGHKYQLAEARRITGCDYLIVVMGGAFSQRGETMCLDKWTRARMALENGADLVVELPALFAVRSADWFALGGVQILAGLGADSLCFGCETDDLSLLHRMLTLLSEEDDELKSAIRMRLDQGLSHVRARGEAVSERLNLSPDAISLPNTVLALEYMRVNRTLARPMDVCAVRRTGSYHDQTVSSLASASAIRAALLRGETGSVRSAMPESAYSLLASSISGRIADMSRLDALLIDRLRTLPLNQLPDTGEGLDNRALKCAGESGSREAFLAMMKCKRYTHARLSRLCAHALLGLTQEMTLRHPVPTYARALGFRKDASPLLTHLKSAPLPLVTRPSVLKDDEIFALERRATDLQSLCFADEAARAMSRDLTEKMIVL
ncbi:MAG: nucleotidyltransferase family protein [Clostridia bacterium]|nr:nucleotidyltransferase family protein [Clostridia bacterium]